VWSSPHLSIQVADAVVRMDGILGDIMDRINTEVASPVNIVVVSDHGMTTVSPNRVTRINTTHLNLNNNNVHLDMTSAIVMGMNPNGYYNNTRLTPQQRNASVTHLIQNLQMSISHPEGCTIYRREQIPHGYYYNYNNLQRIPPVVILPKMGWSLLLDNVWTRATGP